jgi:hypothetical protein
VGGEALRGRPAAGFRFDGRGSGGGAAVPPVTVTTVASMQTKTQMAAALAATKAIVSSRLHWWPGRLWSSGMGVYRLCMQVALPTQPR